MKWFCRHWYDIGVIVFFIALITLVLRWSEMELTQKLLLMNFMALLFHQFEEYRFPGGEPAIMNMALRGSDIPDRYPLNQLSAMITNVIVAYLVYLPPVFLTHVTWLGLGPVLFGFMQFMVHGIVTNIKLRSFYNPGLFAVVFMHIPVGALYIRHMVQTGLIGGSDWLFAVLYLFVIVGLIVNGITYRLLPNRDTKWIFDEDEMKRFNVETKLRR